MAFRKCLDPISHVILGSYGTVSKHPQQEMLRSVKVHSTPYVFRPAAKSDFHFLNLVRESSATGYGLGDWGSRAERDGLYSLCHHVQADSEVHLTP